MPVEIERKYLIRNDSWRKTADRGTAYIQSFPMIEQNRAIRIRIAGNRGFLTLKYSLSITTRKEYEYEIPLNEARELIQEFSDHPPIEKIRYHVHFKGHLWEIDVFGGENEGLEIAEVELSREDEYFEKPDWIGNDVTEDDRYLNVNLYLKPFKTWAG